MPVASLKLPPITQLSFSTTRAKDWDDILTAHKQEAVARTWTIREKRLGKHVMKLLDENSMTDNKKRKVNTAGSIQV